jgi:Flp pilus assembly protein TadG
MVLTAVMAPVLFGAALVSTDTVVIVNAEAQMKTAADAAALAGAMALVDETRVRGSTNLTSLMSSARAKAISVATTNPVLEAKPVIQDNPSNSPSGDVVIGYLSPNDTTSLSPSTTSSPTTFNSVQVTVQRNATHGGSIPTFFGRILGVTSSDLSVDSTAIAQNYSVGGFQSVNGQSVNLLPFVLDSSTYTSMINRTTTDQYTYNSTSGTVSSGSDGVPESQLYPVSGGNPGNWGTIKVGVTNNSTSTLSSQIQNGISPSQLATFSDSKIQLGSGSNPPSITFSGNPGISAGIKSALDSRIGKTGYIGVYDQSSGNGNNTTYRVVAFAAIRIMAVNFQGNPKYVIVQPALVNDASVITGSAQSSWTNGGVVKVRLTR